MLIEIWSDVACPFCFVGKRHLEQALTHFAHADTVEVKWRSFQLAPDMPNDPGVGMDEMLATKYGKTIEEARAMNHRVTEMGAAAGLDFRLDIGRPTNTFDAHRLIHLAAAHGRQDAAKERLLTAYFTEGALISDHDTLTHLGAEVGLDAGKVADMLAGQDYGRNVQADIASAREFGLSGVPAFVFDRKLLISGAQPVGQLLSALVQQYELAEREQVRT
ncbi:MAG: DsbA family oxidoreductase [Thermoleophilia bacterium]|nr:DsbA family oxidoreductase [Thermoleophilia bacterium]